MRISVQPPPPINASKLPLQHFFDMKEYSKPFQIIFNRFLAFQRLKNPFFNKNLRFKVFFLISRVHLSMAKWPPPIKKCLNHQTKIKKDFPFGSFTFL